MCCDGVVEKKNHFQICWTASWDEFKAILEVTEKKYSKYGNLYALVWLPHITHLSTCHTIPSLHVHSISFLPLFVLSSAFVAKTIRENNSRHFCYSSS
jgi:hypothetical protein